MSSVREYAFTVPRDDDRFVLSPRAATYVAFLNVGYSSDDATVLADYALAHPHKLLEDCKPSIARDWVAAEIAKTGGAA
ncbi:MAG: hypothetical protein WBF99_12525 [Xanthobacteraceae bacterium]